MPEWPRQFQHGHFVPILMHLYPTSQVAPEALYWASVAKYKASHDRDQLIGTWAQLRSRYPLSIWPVKQSFGEQG